MQCSTCLLLLGVALGSLMSWLRPAAVGSGLAGAAVVGKCGPGQNMGPDLACSKWDRLKGCKLKKKVQKQT